MPLSSLIALCLGCLCACEEPDASPSAGASSGGAEPTGGQGGGGAEGGARSYEGLRLNELAAKGSPSDWIELHNSSSEELDLSGCGLSDDPIDPLKGRLPEGSLIPAGGFLLVEASDERLGFKLGPAEQVTLSSPSGALIDEVSYTDGQSPAGGSYGRLPDGEGPWETLYAPSPGAPNERGEPPECGDLSCEASESPERCPEDCVSCGDGLCDPSELERCELDCPRLAEGALLINEVVAAGSPDWIELLNLSDEDLDLTGYSISDDLAQPFKATLSGVSLPASGHLVVLISDETVGFKLGGDELALISDPEGAVIDLVDWREGDAPEGMSWGRSPDGSSDWQTLTPSPGEANGSP